MHAGGSWILETRLRAALVALAVAAYSCSDDEPADDGDGANAVTAAEKYTELAVSLGCDIPESVEIPEACELATRAWVDCLAQDTQQCHCESDGDLNCEGGHKPNEGPALCIEEAEAAFACES